MSWCEDYIDPFPRECEHGVPDGINCSECRADADYASTPHPSALLNRSVEPTLGADGRYCTHHDDDPAHTTECYKPPSNETDATISADPR